MRVDSRVNKYKPRNSNRRAVEKSVADVEALYMKQDRKLDATFATDNNSNPFLSANKSYGINGIDSLVVGHFGEVNKGFKQFICSLAKVTAESQVAGNITPASSTDNKRKDVDALFKKRFKVALGCMTIRTQTELMIRRVQIIRRTKEAATHCMRWKCQRISFKLKIHGSVTGKMMTRIICFDQITIATTPLPNQ